MFRNQKQFFHPNKKYFLDSSTQTKNIFQIPRPKQKNIFRFLDPNKKYFSDSSTRTKNIFIFPQPKQGIFMTKSLLLFPAGCFQLVDFVSSAESRSWKWNKNVLGIRNSSFIQTKKYFSDSSTQKNIFRFLDLKQKKYFRFLDPNKKKYF